MCLSSFNEALEHVPLPLRPDPLRPVSGSSRTKSRPGCPLSLGDLHSTDVPKQAVMPPIWAGEADRSHTVAHIWRPQLVFRAVANRAWVLLEGGLDGASSSYIACRALDETASESREKGEDRASKHDGSGGRLGARPGARNRRT